MSYPITEKKDEKPKIGNQELSYENQQYKKYVVERLISAMNVRDTTHDEFDGMTFLENFEFNRKMAQQFIPPRKNATDVAIVSGIARQKMKAMVANIMKLNLGTNILAFDGGDNEDVELGHLMTNTVRKAKELDEDQEKQVLRYYELFEQGTVFIGESWAPTVHRKKRLNGTFDPAAGAHGITWEEEEIVEYKAERKIYNTLEMYLGNIRQFELEKQPYIYRRVVMDYMEAKAIFGNWAQWRFIKPGGMRLIEDGSDSIAYNNFRLYDLQENQVEIIYYEDLPNCEYQIFIAGVMMLPARFPMPWGWDGYSCIKAVLDTINKDFAYGRSLMNELRFDAEVYDNMFRMLIHKTQQSIKPPTANNTGSVLSPRIFDPGTMVKGVDAKKLESLITHQGVTSSEFNMFSLIKTGIDAKSVNPVFQGQQASGDNTATEILTTQKQAEIAISLTLFAISLMEEKADYLKLYNVLDNWTKPIDETIDPMTKQLTNKYRTINIDNVSIDGRMGSMKVEMLDKVPSQQERLEYSIRQWESEGKTKKAAKSVRLILPILRTLKYNFFIRCVPTDKPSDNLNKILFDQKMKQAMTYFGQDLNMDYFKRSWATAWQENPEEAFSKMSMQGMKDIMEQTALRNGEERAPQGSEGQAMGGSTSRQRGRPGEKRGPGTGIEGGLARATGAQPTQLLATVSQ